MSDKAQDFIRTYWPILAALLLGAGAWGTSTAQIDGIAKMNQTILTNQNKQADALADIKASIAGMQATSAAASSLIADLQLRLRAVEARR